MAIPRGFEIRSDPSVVDNSDSVPALDDGQRIGLQPGPNGATLGSIKAFDLGLQKIRWTPLNKHATFTVIPLHVRKNADSDEMLLHYQPWKLQPQPYRAAMKLPTEREMPTLGISTPHAYHKPQTTTG
jgi:hypothetical protein